MILSVNGFKSIVQVDNFVLAPLTMLAGSRYLLDVRLVLPGSQYLVGDFVMRCHKLTFSC